MSITFRGGEIDPIEIPDVASFDVAFLDLIDELADRLKEKYGEGHFEVERFSTFEFRVTYTTEKEVHEHFVEVNR